MSPYLFPREWPLSDSNNGRAIGKPCLDWTQEGYGFANITARCCWKSAWRFPQCLSHGHLRPTPRNHVFVLYIIIHINLRCDTHIPNISCVCVSIPSHTRLGLTPQITHLYSIILFDTWIVIHISCKLCVCTCLSLIYLYCILSYMWTCKMIHEYQNFKAFVHVNHHTPIFDWNLRIKKLYWILLYISILFLIHPYEICDVYIDMNTDIYKYIQTYRIQIYVYKCI